MTDHTADALASALPAGVMVPLVNDWHAREIAAYQAEELASEGYVLVPLTMAEPEVERLARAIHDADCWCQNRVHSGTGYAPHHRRLVEAALAALAGTSAQARHTADNATGGAA